MRNKSISILGYLFALFFLILAIVFFKQRTIYNFNFYMYNTFFSYIC